MRSADQINRPDRVDGGTWAPEPAAYPPVFTWPPRPLAALRWLPGFVLPYNALYVALAAAVWWLATPSVETMSTFGVGWVAIVFVRNAVLISVLYGLSHWWLYVRRGQGDRFKFNRRWPAAGRGGRTFGSQTRETVFWTLASGLPIWTAWEVVTLWLFAGGRIPWLAWSDSPIWFIALFPLVALFREIHFYAIHRLIHWPPLYKRVHSLHHRNVNPSPWSGLSMHPVEHLLYFSALAIHWIVPSHPLHAMFNSIHLALSPIPGHTGFDRFELGKAQVASHGYAHYLHHKLFEVNYADGVIPLDRWFGSFHDGSPEADELLKQRKRARAGRVQPATGT